MLAASGHRHGHYQYWEFQVTLIWGTPPSYEEPDPHMRGSYPSYEGHLFHKNWVLDLFLVLKNLASLLESEYARIFPLRHLEPCQIEQSLFLEQKESLIWGLGNPHMRVRYPSYEGQVLLIWGLPPLIWGTSLLIWGVPTPHFRGMCGFSIVDCALWGGPFWNFQWDGRMRWWPPWFQCQFWIGLDWFGVWGWALGNWGLN